MLANLDLTLLASLFERIAEGYESLTAHTARHKDLSLYLIDSARRELSSAKPDTEFIAGALRLAHRELKHIPNLAPLCQIIEAQIRQGPSALGTVVPPLSPDPTRKEAA